MRVVSNNPRTVVPDARRSAKLEIISRPSASATERREAAAAKRGRVSAMSAGAALKASARYQRTGGTLRQCHCQNQGPFNPGEWQITITVRRIAATASIAAFTGVLSL